MFINFINSQNDQFGKMSKPITLQRPEQSRGSDRTTNCHNLDKKIPIFSVFSLDNNANASDLSLSDLLSHSSIDLSLRVAVVNFNDLRDLDSECFNAKLANFIENEKN